MTNATEVNYIDELLRSIHRPPREIEPMRPGVCVCSPTDATRLLHNMRAYDRAFIVRRILEYLNFDETWPFMWNMDHKLIQALVLRRALPEYVPAVAGLSELANTDTKCNGRLQMLKQVFPFGYVIKPARGYGCTRERMLLTAQANQEFSAAYVNESYDGTPLTETYYAQQLVTTVREYRVHTLGNEVMPRLTERSFGSNSFLSGVERQTVNHFVARCVERLPTALLSQSLCGWDIGQNEAGDFSIFEINFSGCHPVHKTGFHCSGKFQDLQAGVLNVARLMRYLELVKGIRFEFEAGLGTNPLESDASETLFQISRWKRLLEISDDLYDMFNEVYNQKVFYNVKLEERQSLGARIYSNDSEAVDRLYLDYVGWLKKMTDDLR